MDAGASLGIVLPSVIKPPTETALTLRPAVPTLRDCIAARIRELRTRLRSAAADDCGVSGFLNYVLRETKQFIFALGLIMLIIGFPLVGGSRLLTTGLLVLSVVLYFYAWAALSVFSEGPAEAQAADDS